MVVNRQKQSTTLDWQPYYQLLGHSMHVEMAWFSLVANCRCKTSHAFTFDEACMLIEVTYVCEIDLFNTLVYLIIFLNKSKWIENVSNANSQFHSRFGGSSVTKGLVWPLFLVSPAQVWRENSTSITVQLLACSQFLISTVLSCSKVSGRNSATITVIEDCVVWCGSKNKHQKDMCLEGIGLHV